MSKNMRNTGNFWIVYPFTPESIGATEDYVVSSNLSNAFYKAMRMVQDESSWRFSVHYMNSSKATSFVRISDLDYWFYPVNWSITRSNSVFGKQWSLVMLCKILISRPQGVLIFIGFGWFALMLALCCRLINAPYVIVLAGWGVSQRRAQRWYMRYASRVIVHTNIHRNHLASRGFDTSNFTVMPMGVDVKLFRPCSAKESMELEEKAPRFIFVARIAPRKNLIAALKAFHAVTEHYPSASFDVVGPVADDVYWAQVQRFIEEHNLGESVHFLGSVPNEDLPSLYQSADLMLFPTLSESFGFVIAESMACGTPVVALRGKGAPDELIEHNVSGLLVDEAELAIDVIRLIKDRKKLRMMSEAARRRVEEYFSEQRTYKELVLLLESIKSKT